MRQGWPSKTMTMPRRICVAGIAMTTIALRVTWNCVSWD